jgi:predicted AAA+ superfamily ATPase
LADGPSDIFTAEISFLFFVWGSGNGKTELLKQSFSTQEAVLFDLLDSQLAGRLSAYPNEFLQLILPVQGAKEWVFIDEVQKAPQLLEIVHSQISKKNFKFALGGSSARKLKRVSETQEVDLIVEKASGEVFLCEIKSTDRVDSRYTHSLKHLSKDFPNSKSRLISNDPKPRQLDGVLALH